MSVRFDLDRDADRRAWDYLQSVSGSRNKAVIDALCAYGDNSAIAEIVRSTIQECLQNVTVSHTEPALQITEDESDLLDSLDAFLG
jgi:hypothetical protein